MIRTIVLLVIGFLVLILMFGLIRWAWRPANDVPAGRSEADGVGEMVPEFRYEGVGILEGTVLAASATPPTIWLSRSGQDGPVMRLVPETIVLDQYRREVAGGNLEPGARVRAGGLWDSRQVFIPLWIETQVSQSAVNPPFDEQLK